MNDLITYSGETAANSIIRREDINNALYATLLALQNSPKNAQATMHIDQTVKLTQECSFGLNYKEAFFGIRCSGKTVSQNLTVTIIKQD